MQIINEIMSAETYSNLAYPNGCRLSAGLLETLNPRSVTPDEIPSERTLTASDISATEPLIKPTENVATHKTRFVIIP